MKHLVTQPHILMSVQDPYHPASSEISHEDAIGILSGNGKYNNVHSAKGKYGNIQDTIFISNPSEAQVALAHKIAEETGQDSLIESDGHSHKMIVTNGPDKGSVTYGKGTTWHEQEPEDYYTTLPTGEHFTHNFDEADQSVQKSEDLEKSKNVREQRAKVFGTDPNAPRISNKRMKMMQAIQGYAQKKYGLPLVTASGKRDVSGQLKEEKGIEQQPYDVFSSKGLAEEKARQEKVKQLGLKRMDPKPDWKSGQLETQPSPDAAVHELAHLDLAPEGMTAPEFQDLMDRRWGESQKKYGHMQQKKTQGEIQPMALENPIRRELGLPANRATKPVTEGQTALDDPNQQRFVQGKDPKGRTVFYDRQSRLMNPETKERLTQVREGSVKFDPKAGWQPSSDVNALINLRGRGMGEEAQKRAKQKFSSPAQPQPKKLAANEEMSKSEQLRKRCWEGYKAVAGKKPYSKGSCAPISKADSEKPFHGYSKEKHAKTGGLNDKYREKYNREHGSHLKRPVTGKVKAGSKAAGRRKSFCARMSGVKGPTSKDGKLTPKGAALKRWKCSKSEDLEKGALGDWQKEGYKISHEPWTEYDDNDFKVFAHDKNGNLVGETHILNYPDVVESQWTDVHPSHRRKGIASAMYQYAEKLAKKPIQAAEAQSDTGASLWSQPNRPFGKSDLEKGKLEHYSSQQGLKTIDPKFKGRGVDIRTKGRDTEHPHSFFYRAGTLPEDVVASGAKSKYTVEIPDEMPLYDLATDNQGHITSAIEQNQGVLNMDMVHQNLKDAGYQGFYNSAHPQLSNVVALYHEQPVSEEREMEKSNYTKQQWQKMPLSQKKQTVESKIREEKTLGPKVTPEAASKLALEEMLRYKDKISAQKKDVKKQEGTDCDDHLDPLKKPYASEAQRRWAHTEAGKKALGGKKAVAHWDKATRGKDLPEKVKKKELNLNSLEKVSREEVAQSHILMFPVSINGQHKDEHENIPDYHITLKWMGNNPHKTPEEIQNIVQKHGLTPPESFDLHPHIFNTPNGPAHVLLLNGNLDSLHHAKREIDIGNPDRYPSYLPHITVSKKIHDAVKEHGLTAKDLNIQVHPLEYRVGEQTIKRYE